MPSEELRLLVLVAHPDDAEFHAGGLAARYTQAGHVVKFVSVTDGGAGHHQLDRDTLIRVRRQEAKASANVIGAQSEVWDLPDGMLVPSLDLRLRLVREIRSFRPDLVLTHRTCDYHPDHRAVGQAVQDASYMVTVPLIAPETPALIQDPVVAYMVDLFTKPLPMQPDIVLDVTEYLDVVIRMLAQHKSQVFQFLPHNFRYESPVPEGEAQRHEWLKNWFMAAVAGRADRFQDALGKPCRTQTGDDRRLIEAYEISEYAAPADELRRKLLFGA